MRDVDSSWAAAPQAPLRPACWPRGDDSVVMVHRDPSQPESGGIASGEHPQALQFLGQIDAVEAARFHPNHGNLSRWAGKAAEATSDEPGYHVARRAFDRRLREHARAQGARIVEAHVQHVEFGDTVHDRRSLANSGDLECTRQPASCSTVQAASGVVARKGCGDWRWATGRWPSPPNGM